MIDDHRVAGEVQIARQHDAARIRRQDRRALRTRKVLARVRAAELAVEDASRAESSRAGSRHRFDDGPLHKRDDALAAHSASSSFTSFRIRPSISAGGFTNAGST